MIGGSNLWSQGKNPKLTPVLVVDPSLLGHTAQRWHTRHTSFCCRRCRHNDIQGGGIMRSIQTGLVVHGRFRFSSSQWLVAVSVELWVTGHGFPPTWRADWSPDAEMSLSNRHSIFFRADHCAWRCTPKMWWFNHFGYEFFRNSKNLQTQKCIQCTVHTLP